MKNIKKIKIVILFLVTFSSQAQYTIEELTDGGQGHPKQNQYYSDSNNTLNKFVGTWVYSSQDKYLKVKFYKVINVENCPVESSFQRHHFLDELRSFIEYKVKEGNVWVTKYNTFLPTGTSAPNVPSCAYSGIHGNGVFNSNIIFLHYTEPSPSCERRYSGSLYLKYDNETIPKLKWDIRNVYTRAKTAPCSNGQTMDYSEFIIPRNLILTKID
jgi:hypothetical protein